MFCFDRTVFDPTYFRQMMQESRRRKREAAERVRQMLATSRSSTYFPEDPPLLPDMVDLEAALHDFVTVHEEIEPGSPEPCPSFDLDLYRRHVGSLVEGCVVDFDGVSALLDDLRLDRVFRFMAVVFMDHDGDLCIEQRHDGRITLVGT